MERVGKSELERNADNLFEFVMYLNDKDRVVCGREFIVEDFNPDALNSFDIKDMVDDLVGVDTVSGRLGYIPSVLKKICVDNSWKYFNPWKTPEINRYEADLNLTNKENFFFEVRKINPYTNKSGNYKHDKYGRLVRDRFNPYKLVASRSFSANLFPKKVRHFVDLSDSFSTIISIVKDGLSKDEYSLVK